MPLIDTQPDAVARVYAQSLYELADAQGGRGKVEEVLAELEDVLELARGDATFGEFLSSPAIGADARGAALGRVFGGRVTDLTVKFLRTLNGKGRLGHLPAITAAFDSLVQHKFGRVEVDAFTAAPMNADEVRTTREGLARALGKDVVLHPYVDATMIGGVKFRIGDQLLDGSVSTSLRNLKDRLDSQGASKLRSSIQRIIDDPGR